jgi:HSP20 family protein
MQRSDFNVYVDRGMLIIEGVLDMSKAGEDKLYTRKEFNQRPFRRSFWIPSNVVLEEITAHYENGLLKVRVPKKKKAEGL